MKIAKIIIALSLFFCFYKSQTCSILKNKFENFNEAKALI